MGRITLDVVLLFLALGLQTFPTLCQTQQFEHIIQKRQLRGEGFTHFQSARTEFHLEDNIILNSHHEVRRHVRNKRAALERLEIHLHGDSDHLELELNRAPSVVSEQTKITVVKGNVSTDMPSNTNPDCFFTGRVKNSDSSIVSMYMCDKMYGHITDETHTYWLEHMDTEENHADTKGGNLYTKGPQIFLAKKPTEKGHTCSQSLVNKTEWVDRVPDAFSRKKRAGEEVITIEMAIILDQEYLSRLAESGITSVEDINTAMIIKWNGAQAEWGRVSVLQYDVRIQIKAIELWTTNRAWYYSSTLLSSTLNSVCSGASENSYLSSYDHIHLFAGKGGTDVAGKAYIGEACTSNLKCAVTSWTGIVEFTIAAHELGHNLGMAHDQDVGCPNELRIMGGNIYGWSSCSVRDMTSYLQSSKSACLRTTEVSTAPVLSLTQAWPGMVYTDDEICQLQKGPLYKFRSYPVSAWGICTLTSCILMDTSSAYYGISFKYPKPTDGKYCGDQKVCSSEIKDGAYQCLSWADTGLSTSLFTVVEGAWSVWGSWSECSRTCGTGLRHRVRVCNNPKPQNSAGCPGDEYSAIPCNTDPCEGDDAADLITKRASEVCANWKTNNVYAQIGLDQANFLDTGTKFSSEAHGQCEVKCDPAAGYTVPSNQRFGLMPDGTPCTPPGLTFPERNGLPQASGKYGRCVQGYCLEFGCNNETSPAHSRDVCGVCNGDGSTCQLVSGTFTTAVAQGSRGTIASIPKDASNIQVWYVYTDMRNAFIHLFNKDNAAITGYANSPVSSADTTANPVTFAGTYWYYVALKQYLYADGPLTEPAIIKLFNQGGNANPGINYAYTMPVSSTTCSGFCLNGGTFNTNLCCCNCAATWYGTFCLSKCNTFCKNEMTVTTTCTCDCQGNTYGTKCNCKYPFTGINCGDCKVTSCKNGGTFNGTSCRCTCPPGYGSLDCSTPCEDADAATVDCAANFANGKCTSDNENMEAKCYKTCGLCEPASTTTATTTTTTTTATTTTTTTATTTTPTPTTTSSGGGSPTVVPPGSTTTLEIQTTTSANIPTTSYVAGTTSVSSNQSTSTAVVSTSASASASASSIASASSVANSAASTSATTIAHVTKRRHCRDVETDNNATGPKPSCVFVGLLSLCLALFKTLF